MQHEPTTLCENCRKPFPQSKLDLHEAYCRRHVRKCPKCEQMVDANHMDEHIEEFHTSQKCPFCKKDFEQSEINIHKEICQQQPMLCDFCEQTIPVSKLHEHQEECGSRTRKCQKCESPILYRNYYAHLADCPGKLTPTQMSYANYINRERERMNLPPKQVMTTPTVTTTTTTTKLSSEPQSPPISTKIETVRVATNPNTNVVRHEVKELGTRVIQPRKIEHHDQYMDEYYDDYSNSYEHGFHQAHVPAPVYSSGVNNNHSSLGGSSNKVPGLQQEDAELQRALMESLGYK